MMHQEDMDRTLLSARKAYRFLFEYQTRIKDLAHFISIELTHYLNSTKHDSPS